MQRFFNHCLGLVKETKYRAREYLGTIHTARLAILEVTASSSKTSFPSPPDLTSATSFTSSSSLELFSAFGASSPSASPRSSSWILLACVHCQVMWWWLRLMCPTDLIFKDILPRLKESRLKGFCIVYRRKSDCQRLKQNKLLLVLTLTNYLLLGLVLFTQGISKVSLSFPNPRLYKKKRGKL